MAFYDCRNNLYNVISNAIYLLKQISRIYSNITKQIKIKFVFNIILDIYVLLQFKMDLQDFYLFTIFIYSFYNQFNSQCTIDTTVTYFEICMYLCTEWDRKVWDFENVVKQKFIDFSTFFVASHKT